MQQTLQKQTTLSGIGLHTGQKSTVTLKPALENVGVTLTVNGTPLPLHPTHVTETTRCTKVEASGVGAMTIEHLFAALHALGVDNCVVDIVGEGNVVEVPILDGSSLPWINAINEVGLLVQSAPKQPLKITEKQTIELPTGTATVQPHDGLKIEIQVSFPVKGIEKLNATYEITPEIFAKEIAAARTFCLQKEVEAMRAAGLIKGGSLDCAVVFNDNGQPVNPEGLRYPDEPLRHKVLDVVGDLFLYGKPIHGHFIIPKPGHGVNNVLLQQLKLS